MAIALQSNAVIGVDDFKQWAQLDINDPAPDDMIAQSINLACDDLEEECRRSFLQAAVTDESHDGNGQDFLIVDRWPIKTSVTITVKILDCYGNTIEMDPLAYRVKGESMIVLIADYPLGWRVFPHGVANILLSYTGGYLLADIPGKLKEAARLLTQKYFQGKGRDPSVMSESGGSFARQLESKATLPPEVLRLIAKYKMPLMASVASRRTAAFV